MYLGVLLAYALISILASMQVEIELLVSLVIVLLSVLFYFWSENC